MTRREFIGTAGATVLAGAADAAFGQGAADARTADYAARQAEIDAITPKQYADYMARRNGAALDRLPAFVRLDGAFDKVAGEVRSAVVKDKPAVWFVYNMGVVVKTPRTCFSIDLTHRKAPEIAPLLDFMLVTHNHGDHYTHALYKAMDGHGKTVISNFLDNYGAKDWKANGGFTRAAKEFTIKDVTIRTTLTDHNSYLVDFTTAFEVRVGDYVIYHTGDCSNVGKLNPTKRPDLWIVHPRCGMPVAGGVKKFRPETTVIAHLNELGHARNRWRWTFQDGQKALAAVEAAGGKGIVPVWGERIV